jgi:hypothetical protein
MKKNQKVLYQIGNGDEDYYIFPSGGLEFNFPGGKKEITNTSELFDGVSLASGVDRLFKQGWAFSITWSEPVTSVFNLNYIQKIVNQGMKKIFFYEETSDGDIKVFFNYGIFTVNPDQRFSSTDTSGTGDQARYIYTGQMLIPNPFFYECDEELKYFDEAAYRAITPLRFDQGWNFDSGENFDSTFVTAFPAISGLSVDAKKEIFATCGSGNRKPLYFEDRFIAQDKNDLATSNLKTVSLSTNDLTQETSNTLAYKQTTAINSIYLIKFDPLGQNEWIEIKNTSNNSGTRITWVGDTANTNDVVFNSRNGVFVDSVTEEYLNYTKVVYDIAENVDDFLYFSPLYSRNPFLGIIEGETLTFQKSASSNNTISIDLLKTYN